MTTQIIEHERARTAAVKTLHVFQDLATPHNNALIEAFRRLFPDVRLVTWYTMRTYDVLPWKDSLAQQVDNHYCDSWGERLRVLWRVLAHPDETFLIVGYLSMTARVMMGLFWLLRRDFLYWSDHPVEEKTPMRRLLRRVAYAILRRRARRFFVVGQHTADYFSARGFPPERITNLPVFVSVPRRAEADRGPVRERYGVGPDQRLAVAASRLDYNKGYDLLLEAIAMLDDAHRARLRLVIVGSGPEEEKLRRLASTERLRDCILFQPWLEPAEYAKALSAADFFLHPARFDAFGGGTLYAMAAGVPVIGSDGAGSAVDRIRHGENGLIYPRRDVAALADRIRWMLDHDEERRAMGRSALATAEEWPPERGARILYEAMA